MKLIKDTSVFNMHTITVALLISALTLPTIACSQSASEEPSEKNGASSQESNQYSKAFEQGEKYLFGRGVDVDYTKSLRYLKEAAKGELVSAYVYLGYHYLHGYGVPINHKLSYQWFKKAYDKNASAAFFNVGWHYYSGEGVSKNYKKAHEAFLKDVNANTSNTDYSLYHLGKMYESGLGVNVDYKKAATYLLIAAQLGHVSAQADIGAFYMNGSGVKQDSQKAFHWSKKAAAEGNAPAQYNLCQLYKGGNGVKKAPKKAYAWCEKASDQGNVLAMVNTGYFLTIGLGVKKDVNKAVQWYKKAADTGNTRAKLLLSMLYLSRLESEKEINESVRLLKEVKNSGDVKYSKMAGETLIKVTKILNENSKAIKLGMAEHRNLASIRAKQCNGRSSSLSKNDLNTSGLTYGKDLLSIYRGEFSYSRIDKGSALLLNALDDYLRAYAKACSSYLPANKVEILDKKCSTEKVTKNGFGTEIDRSCVSWINVRTGLYADPVLYSALGTAEKMSIVKMFSPLLSGDLDGFAKSLLTDALTGVAGTIMLGNDMSSLIQKNKCNSEGIRRFEANLISLARGTTPLLICE